MNAGLRRKSSRKKFFSLACLALFLVILLLLVSEKEKQAPLSEKLDSLVYGTQQASTSTSLPRGEWEGITKVERKQFSIGETVPEKSAGKKKKSSPQVQGNQQWILKGIISGQVTDLQGTPLTQVQLDLSIELASPTRRKMGNPQTVYSDKEGNFSFVVDRGGSFLINICKRGFNSQSHRGTFPSLPFKDQAHFSLEPIQYAIIRGRLLDVYGNSLPATEIKSLDLKVSADPEVYPKCPQFSRRTTIQALKNSDGGMKLETSISSTTIKKELSSFEILVNAKLGYFVVVRSGASVISRKIGEEFWKMGDPDLNFRIDTEAIRRETGSLIVEVFDRATTRVVTAGKIQLFSKQDSSFISMPIDLKGATEFLDLLPTIYHLEISSEKYATQVKIVKLTSGKRQKVKFFLERPARIRLRLVFLENWLPDSSSKGFNLFTYFDETGIRSLVSYQLKQVGGEEFLYINKAPPGPGFVVYHQNLLPLDLRPGSNPKRDFLISKPRELTIKCLPHLDSIGPTGGASLWGGLIHESGVLVASESVISYPDDGGWYKLRLYAPPGNYDLIIQPKRGKKFTKKVTIGDSNSFIVRIKDG